MQDAFRKKIFLELGISIGVIAVIIIINSAIASDVSRRAALIVDLKRELTLRTQAQENLSVLKSQSEKAKPFVNVLQNILPESDRLIGLPRDINAITKLSKVTSTLTLGETKEGDGSELSYRQLQISVTGELKTFTDFLKNLEAADYFIGLNAIQYERQINSYRATLKGRVFSR